MDELVRRAALDGTLRRILVVGRQGDMSGWVDVGHVVCDEDYEFGKIAALAAPSTSLLRQAMREEWKLAD